MKLSIKTLIWSLIILAIIVTSVFALIPRPVDVEFAVVSEGPLKVTVQEDGKTRIREKYVVSAPVSGRLSRIEWHSGDEVVGNNSLLAIILPASPRILDARELAQARAQLQVADATLQRSQTAVEQARINLELHEKSFRRAEELLPNNSVSKSDYDIARTEYLASIQAVKTAEFDSEIAQFELEMAQAAVSQFEDIDSDSAVRPFEIHAPISGKVLRVFQESSNIVAVGTALLELGDPRNLEIEIDVLSTDAVRILPGSELTLEFWGGESELKGHVRVVEPAAFTKISSLGVEEQRVNIIADFDEEPYRTASLGDGYRVEARITVKQLPAALLIPNSALFRHQRQWQVMKIVDSVAVMQQVTIGLQNESHSQIVEGLTGGEQVIVYPSDEITSGTVVRAVESTASNQQ